MTTTKEDSEPTRPERKDSEGVFTTLLKELSSARLAIAVGGAITVACILGTLLPQGADVQKYLRANPDSVALMKFLNSLGLTNVFEAWWFIALLIFFSANITACLTRRMSALKKSARLGVGGWGFILTHISVLLILGGAVIRGFVGEKGYLEIREGMIASHFLTSRGPVKLPFDVRLNDFDIEYYESAPEAPEPDEGPDTLAIDWSDRRIATQLVVQVGGQTIIHPPSESATASNAFRVTFVRYVPDFVIDMSTREVGSRSDRPNNPALLVTIEGADLAVTKWLFANHPQFDMIHSTSGAKVEGDLTMRFHSGSGSAHRHAHERPRRIKSFKSNLTILEGGKTVDERTIEVNSPFSRHGYTLYQSGYNPEDLAWSTIQVVRDPGVPMVYAGFVFMIVGLVMLLILKPATRAPAAAATATKNGGSEP